VHTGSKEVKDKEFKKKNPNQKYPVLETHDGCIFETHAIIRHVARLDPSKHLFGKSQFEHA